MNDNECIKLSRNIIKKCKENFLTSGLAKWGEKTICRTTFPIIHINHLIKNYAGFAYCVHPTNANDLILRKRFNLSKYTANKYVVPGYYDAKCYLVMDISIIIFQHREELVFETLSHEFAHVIQFRLGDDSTEDHGPDWIRIHMAMGGSGKDVIYIPDQDEELTETSFII